MDAIILAAGFGTRLSPLTAAMPKALITLAGRPLLDIIISRLLSHGFQRIFINTHHMAEQIESFLRKQSYPATIQLSHEPVLLDTGGGIKKIVNDFSLSAPILVHNVDILTTLDLQALHKTFFELNAEAVLAVRKRQTRRYLLFDENNNLCGRGNEKEEVTHLVRQPGGKLEFLGFSGIQVISPALFKQYPEQKFTSIDLYLSAAESGKNIKAFRSERDYWRDIGKLEDLKEAEREFSNIANT